jgi:hypothetical protein
MTSNLGQMRHTDKGIPWWVNTIYKVGVPTAMACYLVWLLSGKVQTNLEAIQMTLTKHMTEQSHAIEIQDHQLQMLRVICSQGAKSPLERNACFQ